MYQHPTLRYFSTRSLDSRNLFNILKIYVRHFRSKVFLLHALNLICNTGIPTKFLLMIGQKKETCLQLHVLITQRKQTFVSELSSFVGNPVLHLYNKTRHSYTYKPAKRLDQMGWIFLGTLMVGRGVSKAEKISNSFQICFPRAIPGPFASQHIIYNFTQNVFLLLCPLGRIFPAFS